MKKYREETVSALLGRTASTQAWTNRDQRRKSGEVPRPLIKSALWCHDFVSYRKVGDYAAVSATAEWASAARWVMRAARDGIRLAPEMRS